jgi:hypothetical protein
MLPEYFTVLSGLSERSATYSVTFTARNVS